MLFRSARILQTGLEESLTQLGVMHTHIDAHSTDARAGAISANDAAAHREPPYVVRARRHIESHLQTPLCVQDIVAASGASRRALEVGFREVHGRSPMAYVKELRLNRANALLCSSELSLTEIRGIVGYRSAPAFSTDFRKRFGAAPVQVRKSARPKKRPPR